MLKTVRLGAKLLPIFGLLLLLGVSFGLPSGQSEIGSTDKVIDTGGPVQMSMCAPCHKDLNAFDNPNLINFNHSVHFKRGIKCDVCHVVFPHRSDKTLKPTMDLCINCHRLGHGSLGKMAPGKCEICHPADFKLTPDDHDPLDFAGAGHMIGAKKDIQKCLVCHDKESCEGCHSQKGVVLQKKLDYRWYALWPTPSEKGDKITVSGPVAMGSCRPCHLDLQKWENEKLVNFNHPVHFKQNITCDKCHDKWPHENGETHKPEMSACARCHRLDHGSQGQLVKAEGTENSEYCFLCHPREMQLKPDWHTEQFVSGGHADDAHEDRGLCRMCHVQAFCDSCHETEIPHASDWRGEHGQAAVDQAEQFDPLPCMKCHEPEPSNNKAPSCAECHEAVVYPHPEPWAPKHGITAEQVGEAACQTCHREEAFCDKCHGPIDMPHSDNWLGEHRSFLREKEADVCFACHKPSQCEQCHSVHGVHKQYTNFDYSKPAKARRR